jgi:hypothetical protein
VVTHDRQIGRRRWNVRYLNLIGTNGRTRFRRGNPRSPTTVRLVGGSRALNVLPRGFPVSSWVAKSLGP